MLRKIFSGRLSRSLKPNAARKMPIWNFISRAAPDDIARAYAKRMGESYWLGEASGDDNSSLGGGVLVFSDCEPEHVPIKTKSNSMFDFMGFQVMRKSLKKNGERFFECRHEESRRIKERDSSKS